MGSYGNIKVIAKAIADSEAIQNYCITKYGRGLLVQVDMDPNNSPSSEDCPWAVLCKWPSTELGPVSEYAKKPVMLGVGIVPPSETPNLPTVNTIRNENSNGYIQFGNAELAEELCEMIYGVIMAAVLQDNHLVTSVVEDSNGWVHLPMQTATMIFDMSQAQSF